MSDRAALAAAAAGAARDDRFASIGLLFLCLGGFRRLRRGCGLDGLCRRRLGRCRHGGLGRRRFVDGRPGGRRDRCGRRCRLGRRRRSLLPHGIFRGCRCCGWRARWRDGILCRRRRSARRDAAGRFALFKNTPDLAWPLVRGRRRRRVRSRRRGGARRLGRRRCRGWRYRCFGALDRGWRRRAVCCRNALCRCAGSRWLCRIL